MTDKDIRQMAVQYAQLADPLNEALEKQADVRMGFIEGYKRALSLHVVREPLSDDEIWDKMLKDKGSINSKKLEGAKWYRDNAL